MSKLSAILVTLPFLATITIILPSAILGEEQGELLLEAPEVPTFIHVQNDDDLDVYIEINDIPYYVRSEVRLSSSWKSIAYPLSISDPNVAKISVGSGSGSVRFAIGDGNGENQCNIVVPAGDTGMCSFVGRPAYDWLKYSNSLPRKIQQFCSNSNFSAEFFSGFTGEQILNINQAFRLRRQSECPRYIEGLDQSLITHVAKFRVLRFPRPEYDVSFSDRNSVMVFLSANSEGINSLASADQDEPLYGIIVVKVGTEIRGIPITEINDIFTILGKTN